MYIPRSLISHLYTHLTRTQHQCSPPVLILVALDPDALCACRILTALFKRDYIQHTIQPISGYDDLRGAGQKLVQSMTTTAGGNGGVVVCLGVGGRVDLEEALGFDAKHAMGGVDVWVFDARRPWKLSNVFEAQAHDQWDEENYFTPCSIGMEKGKIASTYQPGRGGIFVFDDGDIERDLVAERDAYQRVLELTWLGPETEADRLYELHGEDAQYSEGHISDSEVNYEEDDDDEPRIDRSVRAGQKRKSSSQEFEEAESERDEATPPKRLRSNSGSSISTSPDRPARSKLMINRRQRAVSEQSDGIMRSDSPSSALLDSPRTAEVSSPQEGRSKLLRERRIHEAVVNGYEELGSFYSEPISSLMYSLASELGREDNDLLWQAIVGVSSLELAGRTSNGIGLEVMSNSRTTSSWTRDRGEQIRSVLRDEVRRLNPTDLKDIARVESMGDAHGIIQTRARSPNDNSIRLSPEPRLLLIRHWSLYDSMQHSPFLGAKLHIWSESGRKRLNKFLAKMGISLNQSKQNYVHMDLQLKRDLRERLLKYAPVYGLEGMVPPQVNRGVGGKEGWGFVRCWGWKACLSAIDAAVILGAILEVGDMDERLKAALDIQAPLSRSFDRSRNAQDTQEEAPPEQGEPRNLEDAREAAIISRFFKAYDALERVEILTEHIPTAMHLYRAILRTGTSLLEKKQIRHLRAFRMAVVKEGPDVQLFTHPGALTKLALWVAEAITEMEGNKGRKGGELVMAGLDEARGVYVVVGLGGGSGVVKQKEQAAKREQRRQEREKKREERKTERERKQRLKRERMNANGDDWDSELEEEDETEDEGTDGSDDDEDDVIAEKGAGINRFNIAFAEAVKKTSVEIRYDNFEHCVIEIQKDKLSEFLEDLSTRTVVG